MIPISASLTLLVQARINPNFSESPSKHNAFPLKWITGKEDLIKTKEEENKQVQHGNCMLAISQELQRQRPHLK